MPAASPIVSVVMPCLDEEKTLPACLAAARGGIEAAGIAGEIIVVDNGSHDRSVALAEAAGARVVRCERRGYGNALRAGFAAARGRFILMGDADLSYDFTELPRFWKPIEAGYELVMGSRLAGRIEPGAMPWLHRYVGNPVLSGLLRLLFRVPVSDAHCGLRAFTKDAVERMDLRTGGMELASEIAIKAGAAGLRITEIPITLRRDGRGRPPHLRSFRDGWRHLRYMLMMAPNWLFVLPGLLALGAGALLIALLLPGPLPVGGVVLDLHTMLLGMALVLLGVYLLLLGCFVKAFSYTERLGARARGFAAALRRVKLEHGLAGAGLLVALGLAGDAYFLASWLAAGAGRLDAAATLRPAILYTTLLVAGLQLFFGAFFLSMLGISRGDYVGDYTEAPRS
jgi:glycosyltransferase involved in cell wall biosynthesis